MKNEFKHEIEKGVEMPDRKGNTSHYPFEAMKIEDSFIAGKYTDELVNKVNGAMYYYAKKLNCKFSMRKVGEYLRVWRVE